MKHVVAMIIGLLAAPAGLRAADPPAAAGPNIVFIFADDWGWGDLSCHGHPWLRTPNLDRLASEGIDFRQFNVLNPVCSPSRTAVLTGRYPARYSVHQHFASPAQNRARGMPDWLDPRAPTLPRILRQAGYRTGHFGKWHLTNRQTPGAPTPEAYGYDEARVFNGGEEWPSADVHDTASNTVAFIHANAGRPFFVNAWLHESHTPHVPKPESMDLWKHLDAQKQVYAAVITDGDNAVGRILRALKEAGVERNTIVVFSSDNGPESTARAPKSASRDPDAAVTGYDTYYSVGETGGLRGRKRSLFEGGVRTPLIVRWPGRAPAGITNDVTVVTAVDLLPTFCAAAGVPLPADYRGDGENLLDAWQGKPVRRTRPIFWEWQGTGAEPDWWPRLAVRDGDWKLVSTYDAKRAELHRLPDDRAESGDVAKEHPDIVARLSKLALEWKATLPEKPDPSCIGVAAPAPAAAKGAPQAGAVPAPPGKELPLPGEVFSVGGRTAFLIPGRPEAGGRPRPWVWYAPTLPRLPGAAERWMFEKFRDAGIGVAGIDVGESFGSPAGRKLYSAFYDEMTGPRGHARRPVLLGRSRGGLMTLAWAAENPDKVAGFAGIYPVGNLASYPGVARATEAYGMTEQELQARLPEHNPVDRLAPLAKAGVPLFAIHGDADTVVPLEANSGLLKTRYTALGGPMRLIVPPGQGHTMWTGFFQCAELVEFVTDHARRSSTTP